MDYREVKAIRLVASWNDLTVPEQDIVTFLLTLPVDDWMCHTFDGTVHDLCNAMGVSNKAQNANYRRALFRLEDRQLITIKYGRSPVNKRLCGFTLASDWIERMDGSYLI